MTINTVLEQRSNTMKQSDISLEEHLLCKWCKQTNRIRLVPFAHRK